MRGQLAGRATWLTGHRVVACFQGQREAAYASWGDLRRETRPGQARPNSCWLARWLAGLRGRAQFWVSQRSQLRVAAGAALGLPARSLAACDCVSVCLSVHCWLAHASCSSASVMSFPPARAVGGPLAAGQAPGKTSRTTQDRLAEAGATQRGERESKGKAGGW